MTAARRRLQRVLPAAERAPQPRSSVPTRPVLALGTLSLFVAGLHDVIGLALGIAVGAAILMIGRSPAQSASASPDVVPTVIELIAGCLVAGLPMPAALDAASVAGDEVTREACLAAAAALRRGAPPSEAWQSWAVDPWLEPVARMTIRTTQSGAGVADDLRRVAERLRAQRHSRIQQRVQQASIWIVVPLGLCFMPAFVLVAVVPVVVGLVTHLR